VIGEEKRVYLLQKFKGTIKRRGRSAGKFWECESPAIKLYNAEFVSKHTHTHTHTHTGVRGSSLTHSRFGLLM